MANRSRHGSWVSVFVWFVLCLAAAALWIRSRSTADEIAWTHPESRQQIVTAEGRIILVVININSSTWQLDSSLRHRDTPIPPGQSFARRLLESSGKGFYFDVAGFALMHAERTPSATSRAMSIPIWFVVAVTGLMALCAIVRVRRGPPPGYCPKCGFNVTMSDTTCPKCGAAIPQRAIV